MKALHYDFVAKDNMAEPLMLDRAVYWVNIAYIASVGLTIIAGLMMLYLSQQRSGLMADQVKKAGYDSQRDAATANQRAAEANLVAERAQAERTQLAIREEQLKKQNLDLSMELERQKQSRLELEDRVARLPQTPQILQTPPVIERPVAPTGLPAPAPAAAPSAPIASTVPTTPSPTAARSLSVNQERVLAEAMRHFGDTFVSVIELGDSEAGPLARQITSALQNAKLNVVVNKFGALLPPQHGIICTHGPNDSVALEFVKTLRSFNLTVFERNGTNGQFEVLVGLNPPA
jgi:hypothetical protein